MRLLSVVGLLLAAISSARAQTVEETIAFLVFPTRPPTVLNNQGRVTLTERGITYVWDMKVVDNCRFRWRRTGTNSNSKIVALEEREIDMSQASGLRNDPDGDIWVLGENNLGCDKRTGSKLPDGDQKLYGPFCGTGFAPEAYLADIQDYKADFQARYTKAFAYYQSKFCKGRAF